MRCEDALVHLHEREDGALDAALAPELELHVAACAECAAAAAGLRRVRAALRAMPAVSAPADLRPAVLREIGGARVPGRVLSWPRIAIPIGAAAALFVGAVTISIVRGRGDVETARLNGLMASSSDARTGTGFSEDEALAEFRRGSERRGVADGAVDGELTPRGTPAVPGASTQPARGPASPAAAAPAPEPAKARESERDGMSRDGAGFGAGPGEGAGSGASGFGARRARGASGASEEGRDGERGDAPDAALPPATRIAVFRTEAEAARFIASVAVVSHAPFGGPAAAGAGAPGGSSEDGAKQTSDGRAAPAAPGADRQRGDVGGPAAGDAGVPGGGGGGGAGTGGPAAGRGDSGGGPAAGREPATGGGRLLPGGSGASGSSPAERPSGGALAGGGAPPASPAPPAAEGTKKDAPPAAKGTKPGSPPGAPKPGAAPSPASREPGPGVADELKKEDASRAAAAPGPRIVASVAVPADEWESLVVAANGQSVEIRLAAAPRLAGSPSALDAAAVRRVVDAVARARGTDGKKLPDDDDRVAGHTDAGTAPGARGTDKDAKSREREPSRPGAAPAGDAPPSAAPAAPAEPAPAPGDSSVVAMDLGGQTVILVVVVDPSLAARDEAEMPGSR